MLVTAAAMQTARFAKRLQMDNLGPSEQCLKTNSTRLPGTFVTGTRLIDGCFATSGANCMHASILSWFAEIGDHRYFILDFTLTLLIWDVSPNVATPKGRKLHCGAAQLIMTYKKVLNQLCNCHQLFKKLLNIRNLP